jgi:putative endonuclease
LSFYIYILYSFEASKYYVGYSRDPWKRLVQHNENTGDKYTGKYLNLKIKAVFLVSDVEAEAIRIERYIKTQKSRVLIEKLIHPDFKPDGVLAQLIRVPHEQD